MLLVVVVNISFPKAIRVCVSVGREKLSSKGLTSGPFFSGSVASASVAGLAVLQFVGKAAWTVVCLELSPDPLSKGLLSGKLLSSPELAAFSRTAHAEFKARELNKTECHSFP